MLQRVCTSITRFGSQNSQNTTSTNISQRQHFTTPQYHEKNKYYYTAHSLPTLLKILIQEQIAYYIIFKNYMIQVNPKMLALDHNQKSFHFEIKNPLENKVFFKIKSNNINAVAPSPFFGSIQSMAEKTIEVVVLMKEAFEIKIAVEFCQVDAKQQMELDDWKKLLIKKQIIVIKVTKPAKIPSSQIKAPEPEKEEISETSIKYLDPIYESPKIANSQMLQSKNLGNPVQVSQKRSQIFFQKSSNQIREKSGLKETYRPYVDYQKKYRGQLSQSRCEKLNLSQIQRKINQAQFNSFRSRMNFQPSSKKQISLTYSTIIFGSMIFFLLGYLCALYS